MAINKYKDFECDRCHSVFTKVNDDWLRKHVNQLRLTEGDKDTGINNLRCDYELCDECLNKALTFVSDNGGNLI